MIDNIKIKIENFSGSFENCTPIVLKSNNKFEHFKLHSSTCDSSYLYLFFNIKTKTLTITNSIRKWYLGQSSLIDLTQNTFYKAISLIAKILKISVNELLKSTFTKAEIGLNIRIDTPASLISSKIVKYSTFRRDTYGIGTVNFIGTDRNLKIYDKLNELNAKKKISQNLKLALENANYFFIRIEILMKDKQSFLNMKMLNYYTIEDLYTNFNNLYLLWAKEVSKVLVYNQILYNKSMNIDEYLIAVTLNHEGYLNLINQCNLKIKNTLNKSRQIEKIHNVIEKYPDKKTFNTAYFRKCVFTNLKRISKKESNFNIQEIEKILIPAVNYNKE